MRTVLLVGGAGYAGSVLARELVARGFAVRVFDRFYFGRQGIVGIHDQLEVVQGDMRAVPDAVLQDVDTVINVGGLSNDPTAEYNPRANYEINTVASVELARRCRAGGVSRYLFASSCSIYDRGVLDEEKDVLLDETAVVDPRSAYSSSKFAAEQQLLALVAPDFVVAVLRKGTLYGFSPRMRYDLVVNTFVKDALSKGYLTLHNGGEMWRPLADVRDAARAYVLLLQAEAALVNGQVFNLVHRNYRISEVALRVREALRQAGVPADIRVEYAQQGVRSYRVSGRKLETVLNFSPALTIEESVQAMVADVRRHNAYDFENPRYYNIAWMRTLEEARETIAATGSVF